MEFNEYIYFTIAGLMHTILLICIFFSRKRLKSNETKIYKMLMGCTVIGMLNEIFMVFGVKYIMGNILISNVISKIFLMITVAWIFLLCIYTVIVSDNLFEKKQSQIKKEVSLLTIPLILSFILIIVLPIEYMYNRDMTSWLYTYGPSTKVVFGAASFFITVSLIYILKNVKYLKYKKFIPMYIYMMLSIVVGVLQQFEPAVILISFTESIIIVLMYFTIENPDLKLMDNLYKSKEHAESSNNEKELFLFDMSQRIKQPIKDIEHRCEEVLTYDDINQMKDEIREIDTMAKNLNVTINGLLGISSVESHNVEIVNNKYNLELLLKSIVANYKQVIEDKNLEFRTNIDNTLSEYLYGDSIRVKQIINIIMDNAVKYTEKGYIELDVKVINKYSSCRLMITVEDSGCGIESSKLYKLLNKTVELDESGANKIDDNKNDLITAKLLTSLIGGTIIASSEVGEGSKFTIILDQQIVKEKEDKTLKSFEDNYKAGKRIIVIEEDEKVRKNIEKALSKYDIDIDFLTYGVECLKKIRNKENYDLIIMSENLSKLSSYETMKKLLQVEGFDIPVLAMIEDDSILKDNYSGYGFTDTVSRKPNKFDTGKIIDKYLGGI